MCVAVKSRPCATARGNAYSDLEVFDGTECTGDLVAELSGDTSNLAVAPVVKSSTKRKKKACVQCGCYLGGNQGRKCSKCMNHS